MAELCTRGRREVQEDGEDTDKGYDVHMMVVGKKKKGYLWGSNMDMDME